MKVFVLILQKPLRIYTYTSLAALCEDHNLSDLSVSKSTLEKYPFDKFNFENGRVIISKTYTKSTGDVRQNNNTL